MDLLFVQVSEVQPIVSEAQGCGRIVAGIGPAAIERGSVAAQEAEAEVRIHTRGLIPHRCPAGIGVFAAISVATACTLPGSATGVNCSANDGAATSARPTSSAPAGPRQVSGS